MSERERPASSYFDRDTPARSAEWTKWAGVPCIYDSEKYRQSGLAVELMIGRVAAQPASSKVCVACNFFAVQGFDVLSLLRRPLRRGSGGPMKAGERRRALGPLEANHLPSSTWVREFSCIWEGADSRDRPIDRARRCLWRWHAGWGGLPASNTPPPACHGMPDQGPRAKKNHQPFRPGNRAPARLRPRPIVG